MNTLNFKVLKDTLKPRFLIYAMEIVNCLSCAVLVRGELTISVEAVLGVLGT